MKTNFYVVHIYSLILFLFSTSSFACPHGWVEKKVGEVYYCAPSEGKKSLNFTAALSGKVDPNSKAKLTKIYIMPEGSQPKLYDMTSTSNIDLKNKLAMASREAQDYLKAQNPPRRNPTKGFTSRGVSIEKDPVRDVNFSANGVDSKATVLTLKNFKEKFPNAHPEAFFSYLNAVNLLGSNHTEEMDYKLLAALKAGRQIVIVNQTPNRNFNPNVETSFAVGFDVPLEGGRYAGEKATQIYLENSNITRDSSGSMSMLIDGLTFEDFKNQVASTDHIWGDGKSAPFKGYDKSIEYIVESTGNPKKHGDSLSNGYSKVNSASAHTGRPAVVITRD